MRPRCSTVFACPSTERTTARRDILFKWWELKFLEAAESGAPTIGDRKA
jgi:hypothetical protein